MPKNPLRSFGRRRSSGNVLDAASDSNLAPVQSSFRVLDRPATTAHHDLGPTNNPRSDTRPQSRLSPARAPKPSRSQLRGQSTDDLGLYANRGSAGTTNSGSSGYYESSSASARHSSSSTLPSSLDAERDLDEEELFPRKSAPAPMRPKTATNLDQPLPPPPSFTTRAARAFSFGQKHNRPPSSPAPMPPPPIATARPPSRSPERTHSPQRSPQRERATTTSSYASTAVPTTRTEWTEPDLNLGDTNFGDDFGDMFADLGKPGQRSQESLPLRPPPAVGVWQRSVRGSDDALPPFTNLVQESEPQFPPRTHSRQAFAPSPNPKKYPSRDDTESPYSSEGQHSSEALVSASGLSSPYLPDAGPPPAPLHGMGIAPAFLGGSKAGYSLVPARYSPGPERMSPEIPNDHSPGPERAAGVQDRGSTQGRSNETDPWARKVELRDAQDGSLPSSTSGHSTKTTSTTTLSTVTAATQSQTAPGASRTDALALGSEEESIWGPESSNATPRAAKLAMRAMEDESLFDTPARPPTRASRPEPHSRTESGTLKKMTKAQFEILQRYGPNGAAPHEEEEQLEDEFEDEDDAERAKKATRQRRKQEATMSVYRQQMKKVTGGGPTDLPNSNMRPALDRSSQSAPAIGFHLGGLGGAPPADSVRGRQGEEEDDDVPLGILQAHGFPSSSRPPTRLGENDPSSLQRSSVAGSVVAGGAGQGNLPPFARRLPMDPYFGAGLVNQSNRESLAFGGNGGSVYGGSQMGGSQPQMGHPGGLVGVIAGEERARAARRGSPNPATGAFGASPMALPSNMPPPMPGMPSFPMAMGGMMAPQTYAPSGLQGMPGMPMMNSDAAQQQMQQFLQMQMQMMQNVIAMQQQSMGQTPPPQAPTTDYLGIPLPSQRPTSVASQVAPSFGSAGLNPGRSMTMMNPPTRWDVLQSQQRPNSSMPLTYAPSFQGGTLMGGGGPGAGYTPSIAPSERSNVGMPTRYRPVATNGDAPAGRTQSMTSSLTLQALTQPPAPDGDATAATAAKPTIRILDKPKGSAKVHVRPVVDHDDDDAGWAEMSQKRSEKKFGWRKKGSRAPAPEPAAAEPSLQELYPSFE